MATDITLTYTLTADDLVGAWRQHFRRKVLRSRRTVIGMAVLGICFAGIILQAWCCAPGLPVGMLSMIFAVPLGLGALNYFVMVPLLARQSNLCGKTFGARIREDGVSWRGDEISADSDWSRFHDIVEGKLCFLLYLGEIHYFPLLKSAFASQPDLDAFREFIANRQFATKQISPMLVDAGQMPWNTMAADDGIVLRFRLTETEQVLLFRGKFVRRIVSSRPILALYALFGILAVSAIFMMLSEGVRVQYLVLLTPALAVVSGLAGLFFAAKRIARKSPSFARDQTVVVNEEGLLIDNGLSRTNIAWAHVSGFRKSGDLLVLDMGTDEYMALAKRCFASPDDEARFHEMLKRHMSGV